MLNKFIKILIGLVLLPFCVGFTWQFVSTVFNSVYKPDLPYYFFAGGLTYLTMHVLFRKPILTYVFGHEMTHALFAMLFGGSVKSFQASERGGRVTITKSNFIITLAPYFFPLYTFGMLILYWLAAVTEARGAAGWIVFFVGSTFSFHLILTFLFLQIDQSDIREHGYVFSFPLIYIFNILFAALLLCVLLTKNSGFLDFLVGGIMKGSSLIALFAVKLYGLVQRVMKGFMGP